MATIGFFSEKSDPKAQLDAFNAVHCDRFEYDTTTLLQNVQAGDVVVFHEFFNAGGSMREALGVIEQLHERGADFVCNGSDLDSRTSPDVYRTIDAIYKLALAEPKPAVRAARRRATVEADGSVAAPRASHRGRAGIAPEIVNAALERYQAGESVKSVCEAVGISQGTLYKYIRERGVSR